MDKRIDNVVENSETIDKATGLCVFLDTGKVFARVLSQVFKQPEAKSRDWALYLAI